MHYKAFGLVIESQLELPELLPAATDRPGDVQIRCGDVPDALANVSERGVLYEMNATQFLLQVPDVARYWVTDGKTITVTRAPGADERSVRVFLLGSSLGALLHQRGVIPLHGSAVATPHGAVVFTGASGVGKSTTAALMIRRGYNLLSDDVSVVDFNEAGQPVLYPAYPQQKLWSDTLEKLDTDTTDLHLVRPQIAKFAVPVREAFFAEPLPLRAIYILVAANQEEQVSIEHLTGWFKMMALREQVYRRRFMLHDGATPDHARRFAALAQHVRVCGVVRPMDMQSLDELGDRLEEDFAVWAAPSG